MPDILDASDIELRNVRAWRRKLGIGEGGFDTLTEISTFVSTLTDSQIVSFNANLIGIGSLEEAGYVVHRGSGEFVGRQIRGTTNGINVTYGTGIPGDTILQLPQDLYSGATPTFFTTMLTGLTAETVVGTDALKRLVSTTVTVTAFEHLATMDVLTTDGDLLTHDGTNYVRLPIGADDQFLRVDGTDANWETITAATFPHTILDATVHTDSVTQAVTRGSLIYGNATPLWDELVIGGASTLLRSDGTDPSWGTVSLLSAFHGDTAAAAVARGALIVGNSTPAWGRLVIGGVGTFLRSDGTDASWQALVVGDIPAHDILSATHGDTLAAAVSRGSLIVGNATPKWSELVIGAANRLLRSDGTDASWAQAVLTTDVTGVLPIANGGTNASSFAASEGVAYFDGTRLVNSADLIYSGSELVSRGVSLNGVNEPYSARNINTGASAGTGYEAELADTSNNIITAGYITWTKEQSWTTTASTQDSTASISTTLDGVTASALDLKSSGSVVCGKNSTGTTRTDDFTYICTTNGVPTGVPTTFGSRVPITFDPNTDTLYIYRGGWKGVVVV